MLTDTQKQQVAAWVGEGLSLAQIQSKIEEEFGVSMTYMDVRFLVDDLDLRLRDSETEEKAEAQPAAAAGTPAPDAAPAEPAAENPADAVPAERAGGVALSVDAVQLPGVIASGDVVFSDGARGKWFIDQTGRPGLADFPENYRPPQEDVADFQRKLVTELRKLGLA